MRTMTKETLNTGYTDYRNAREEAIKLFCGNSKITRVALHKKKDTGEWVIEYFIPAESFYEKYMK